MYRFNQKEILDITNYIFLEDALAPADVIFIPGCDRPEHTEEAAKLYREGYAPLLIPSGRYAKAAGHFEGVAKGAKRYGTDFACEADFLSEVLRQNGVPDEAILPEREATYTLENAEKTRELLLREQGVLPKRAILCCKAHHARRAHFYYALVFPEVEILVHPTAIDGITRESWHRTAEGRQAVLGELSRMGQQILMMEDRIEYEQGVNEPDCKPGKGLRTEYGQK